MAASGRLQQALQRPDAACGKLKDSLALFDGAAGADAKDLDRVTVVLGLANCMSSLGQLAAAHSLLGDLIDELADDSGSPSDPTAAGVHELAVARYLETKLELASGARSRVIAERALESISWCTETLQDSSDYSLEYIEGLIDVGTLQIDLGQSADAAATYTRAVLALEERGAQDSPLLLSLLNRMATLQESLGQLQTARAHLQRAIELADRLFGRDLPAATARMYLAAFLRRRGDLAGAGKALDQAHELSSAGLADGDLRSMEVLAARAGLKAESGELDDATEIYQDVLLHAHARLEPHHPFLAAALTALGTVHLARDNPSAALPLFREALGCYGALFGRDHPTVAGALNQVASAHIASGNPTDAKAILLKARSLLEQALPESFDLAANLNLLAEAEWKLDNNERARDLAEEALALLKRLGLGAGGEAMALRRFVQQLGPS